MERTYETGTTNKVTLFTGTEIERTPAFGKKTLFVVGVHAASKLDKLAKDNGCDHIYLGANHSFAPENYDQMEVWENMGRKLLELGYWVTLDFDSRFVEVVLEMGLAEDARFIPVISVKVPYADQLGYNACIKVDDKDFAASNHGVWVHPLRDLQTRETFTDWAQYAQDKIIE
jgi:hypothetical protein